jgi:putative ABC transport system substrate-binding protein
LSLEQRRRRSPPKPRPRPFRSPSSFPKIRSVSVSSPASLGRAATWLQTQIVHARSAGEIDAAFASFARERPDALFVGADPFLTSRRVQLANLASRHALPMITATREITDAGGLMSYGANIPDAWRQVGLYTARLLKGAKPADLPVVQATKLELVINVQTARTLGLAVPAALLATADEVVE